jgi:hypothetical protein
MQVNAIWVGWAIYKAPPLAEDPRRSLGYRAGESKFLKGGT